MAIFFSFSVDFACLKPCRETVAGQIPFVFENIRQPLLQGPPGKIKPRSTRIRLVDKLPPLSFLPSSKATSAYFGGVSPQHSHRDFSFVNGGVEGPLVLFRPVHGNWLRIILQVVAVVYYVVYFEIGVHYPARD